MATRVKYTDIKPQWLNAKCLNLIAKYARYAKQFDGTIIRVTSQDCLIELVEHARKTDSPSLKLIFSELKRELKKTLTAKHLRPKLNALEQHNDVTSLNTANPKPLAYFT